jgi:integral membrane protein
MLKVFKITAIIEGISALLLFFFAMPMKYIYNDPFYVKHIGMAHGILFTLYIVLATILKFKEKWDLKKYFIICLASIPPFGTFYIEYKYLRTSKKNLKHV